MRGVLGGFKNMLIRWRINLKRKKSKEQNNKVVKYGKLKQLGYNALALIYFPIGVIFNSPRIDKKVSNSSSYKQIIKIENKLDTIKKEISNQKEIIEKIDKIEKEINLVNLKNNKQKDNYIKSVINEKIKEVNCKKEIIKSGKVNNIVTKTIIKESRNTVNENELNEKKTNPIISETPLFLKSSQVNKEEKEIFNKPETLISSLKNNKEKDLLFVQKTTTEIKEIEEKIFKISFKIKSTNIYNDLYDYEKDLKVLEIKLIKLKEICLKYNYSIDLDINTDIFEIHKSTKKIDELTEKINEEYKNINIKKDKIYNEKQPKKVVETKEKEQKKNAEEKKIEKKTDELKISQELVLQNIIKQQQLIQSYEEKIKKSKNKRKTLITYLSDLSNQILKLIFSITPFGIFKNRILSTLVSSIFINNSLKSMKKLINPNVSVDYEMIYDIYNDQQIALNNIYRICNDSLNNIDAIRCDIIEFQKQNLDNIEITNLLKKLDTMEEHVIKESLKAKVKGKIIDEQKVKIMKKVS